MSKTTKYIGIGLTFGLTLLFAGIYIMLESLYYHDFGCGCSSGCTGFYVSKASKVIGYVLLICSVMLFIASVWRIKAISIWWSLPALTVFILACYGNGYMLFNKGACGLSVNRTQFFVFQEKIGDFAKSDAETISPDSLKNHKYDSKLLGFMLKGNKLIIYRIAAKPIKLKTGFLFWQPDKDMIIENLSYGLNTFRKPPEFLLEKKIELIGGQDMPMEAFMQELKTTNNWGNHKILHKEIIKSGDGTTRLILSVE